MLYKIEKLLTDEQVSKARHLLSSGMFQDGKVTAGDQAKIVKNNEELNPDSDQYKPLNKMIRGALNSNPLFAEAALPKHVMRPLYARYTKGMSYGEHVDDPYMATGPNGYTRTDVSITVFLSGKNDYEGGELVISTPFGENKVKMDAGDAVFYPSSSLHHVAEVTSGERIVAVTWAESLVRDPIKRHMLTELGQACRQLIEEQPDNNNVRRIKAVHNNLFRNWAGDL